MQRLTRHPNARRARPPSAVPTRPRTRPCRSASACAWKRPRKNTPHTHTSSAGSASPSAYRCARAVTPVSRVFPPITPFRSRAARAARTRAPSPRKRHCLHPTRIPRTAHALSPTPPLARVREYAPSRTSSPPRRGPNRPRVAEWSRTRRRQPRVFFAATAKYRAAHTERLVSSRLVSSPRPPGFTPRPTALPGASRYSRDPECPHLLSLPVVPLIIRRTSSSASAREPARRTSASLASPPRVSRASASWHPASRVVSPPPTRIAMR